MIRYFVEKYITPLLLRYLSTDRKYRYRNITIMVRAGVFHPGFFFSTKVVLHYLKSLKLDKKQVLELGAGSGLISIVAAKQGAIVVASDISEKAIVNIHENAVLNQVELSIVHSDLFMAIPQQHFDIIIINPPYYPAKPKSESEHAWFCGENFEYFQRLFPTLKEYSSPQSQNLMVLSDACQIDCIQQIAKAHGYLMKVVFEKRTLWERNLIYRIRQDTS